jgi:hypothetical protein
MGEGYQVSGQKSPSLKISFCDLSAALLCVTQKGPDVLVVVKLKNEPKDGSEPMHIARRHQRCARFGEMAAKERR